MKNLYFDAFEDLACSVADTYDSLEDVAIVAKYDEARQIIKELLYIGYDIHSVNIIDEEYGEYDAEYIISIYNDEVWCEPMLRENGYITDDSPIMYILDNCSSKVIPYCKGAIIFEVSVGDDECEDTEESYSINRIPATKEEFDEYVSQFKSDGRPSNKDIHIETDSDMHGFSVNHSGENGCISYSFYSTDMDLVNEMAKMFR